MEYSLFSTHFAYIYIHFKLLILKPEKVYNFVIGRMAKSSGYALREQDGKKCQTSPQPSPRGEGVLSAGFCLKYVAVYVFKYNDWLLFVFCWLCFLSYSPPVEGLGEVF